MGTSSKASRTQAERRSKTRKQILDAAVDCLISLGYAKTTTLEVQRRAGLSRGALLHHFPSKTELLISTIHHLAAIRLKEWKQRIAENPCKSNKLDTAIDLIWESFSGPLFYVTMELRSAARNDEELRVVLTGVEMELRKGIYSFSPQLFGEELTSQPGFPFALDLMIQAMIGTAMTALLHKEEERVLLLVEQWKTLFVKVVKEGSHG